MIHQLPVGMVEDDFLARFLTIFQEVADTVVGQIDNLPHVFDVTVAPPPMVRALGAVDRAGLGRPVAARRPAAAHRRRVLLDAALAGHAAGHAAAARADQRRAGRRRGDAAGSSPRASRRAEPVTSCCASSRPGWATDADLLRIVRAELPASVTFELFVGGRAHLAGGARRRHRTCAVCRRSCDGGDRVSRVRPGHVAARRSGGPPTSSAPIATTRCSGRRRRCRSSPVRRPATPRCAGCPAPAGG